MERRERGQRSEHDTTAPVQKKDGRISIFGDRGGAEPPVQMKGGADASAGAWEADDGLMSAMGLGAVQRKESTAPVQMDAADGGALANAADAVADAGMDGDEDAGGAPAAGPDGAAQASSSAPGQ